MRKDFEEIDRRFRDRNEVLAVFHAARFSCDGKDSFVSSNTLLEVFLRFGFSVDLLRRVNQDDSVDTFAVVSAPSKRLEELYTEGGLRLRRPPQARILGIDEFSLHKGHQYAVVIMDLETGHVLYLAKGRKKQTVYDFISFVGEDWMDGVEAVACDRE